MRIDHSPLYDNTIAGLLARLTHGILLDANERAQYAVPRVKSESTDAGSRTRSWLDRLDSWFWKQELKEREAFLAQSADIIDLERRMRWLERGNR